MELTQQRKLGGAAWQAVGAYCLPWAGVEAPTVREEMVVMRGDRGQQLSEYAVLTGIVATVLIVSQMFVSRRIVGVLVTQSHDILGAMLPSDDGTSDSHSEDTVFQQGQADNVHTAITSTGWGTSSAGHFLLSAPPGANVLEALNVNDTSDRQILAELAMQADPNLAAKGYDPNPQDLTVSDSGEVTAVFKNAKNDKLRVSYRVLSLGFDRGHGVWWAQVDTGDGKATPLMGVTEGVDLIAHINAREAPIEQWVASMRDLLTQKDLPENERADLEQGVKAGEKVLTRITQAGNLQTLSLDDLRGLAQAVDGDPAMTRADDAKQRVITAEGKKQKGDVLSHLSWDQNHGEQLIAEGGVTWNKLVEMAQVTTKFQALVKGSGSALGHKEEMVGHLQKAYGLIDKFDERMNRDKKVQEHDFEQAAREMDQAYALLVGDLDTLYQLTPAAGQPSAPAHTPGGDDLAYLGDRPSSGQPLDGAQVDVALGGTGDRLPDLIKVNGKYQSIVWHVVTPGQFIASDNEGGVSAISPDLVTGLTKAKAPQITTALAGPPPVEVMNMVGKSPKDFEGINAWIPLTQAAADLARTGQGAAQYPAAVTPYEPLHLNGAVEGTGGVTGTGRPVTGPGATIGTTGPTAK